MEIIAKGNLAAAAIGLITLAPILTLHYRITYTIIYWKKQL
jgi:hypothetical protein